MKKAIALVLALGSLGYLALRGDDQPARPARGNADLIADRLWVDSKPERYTDYVNALVVIDDVPIGLFQKASAYRMELELFEYTRSGNRIGLEFPQTGKRHTFRYTITACDDLPPFDLCLTLNENPWGGPKRYYSTRDGDAASPELDAMWTRLRDHIDHAPH